MQQQPDPHLIVLMRHAKAKKAGVTDFERELAERGRADARAAGVWLAAQGISPDHAFVSASSRTRETWAAVAEAASWRLAATDDRGLYGAEPDTALDLMRTTPDAARTLMVIGHNPTVAYLAQLLDDGEGDGDAGNRMAMGYPTSAMAVLAYDGDWAEIGPHSARLVGFHVARG